MVLSAALVLAIAAIGVGLTTWTGVRLRLEERLPIGIVVGAVTVSAGSFVGFEAFGMGWAALACGLVLPGAPAVAGGLRHRGVLRGEARRAGARLRLPWRRPASLRPLAVLTLVTGAVSTRILALAYQTDGEGIRAGSLATWADWAAHLAYAGSFAYGDNRVLELPLSAGEPLRYHVLANYFGSLFTVTGLELPQALVWSAWLLAASLPPLMFAFVLRLTGSRLTSGLTVVLFTLTGGVGAWYFAQDVRQSGWRTLTALPQTYARMPEQHLWVDNTISASLYAQRSTLLGVVTGLAAGTLLLAARPAWVRSGFVAAGLLVGTTGISHVHMLFSALALGGLALVVDRRATWWWFLGPAMAVGLPLALAIRPPTSRLRWLPGWMAAQSGQSWPWFWVRNVGLLLPLVLAVALLGGVPRRLRRLSAPLWLWFVVPNLVAFHPSEWNNTKFFLFWQFGACVVVAALLTRAVRGPIRHRHPAVRGAAAVAAAVALVALTSAGALDTLRAMQRSSAIPWVDADDVAAAHWLRATAEPGDTLVYGASNTSAVAALSGVPALTGYPGWTDDLGLPDWRERLAATRTILSGSAGVDALLTRYSVDYVAIGPRERFEHGASDAYWRGRGDPVFSGGDYQIYEV
ncbi:MAG TPA: hypothetical protein VEW93_13095 [Acidimicrobiales bacterium]|nr:hypothetical protein [Acidimicrobiales bacterium]